MSGRRKKSLFITVLLMVMVMAAAGGWYVFFNSSRLYRNAAPLDIPAYISSANSLKGNTYKLEGEVVNSLAWSPSGRLISVGVDNGKKAVPVLLPAEFNSVNIQKGQRFNFLLVVDDKGILRAKKLAKS
jgi:hypothetical protein